MTAPALDRIIEEVERLDGLATPGPWNYIVARTLIHLETGEGSAAGEGVAICSLPKRNEMDAEWMYLSRTALPVLVAEVRRLQAEVAALKASVRAPFKPSEVRNVTCPLAYCGAKPGEPCWNRVFGAPGLHVKKSGYHASRKQAAKEIRRG